MSAGDKVSYTKLEAINEVFPDDPAYVWEGLDNQPTTVDERTEVWFNYIKERFESFEHDKKSSIYRAYGHDYDDPKQRTIKMPNGSTPGGNTTYMIRDLQEALKYRIENFGTENAGWDVFKKVTGRYEVEAVDMTVLAERDAMLRKFLSLLNEDEALTSVDPLTGKEAITEISPEGSMSPIQYMFPMGVEDTDFIHYTVYAPEVIEAKIEGDEQIEDFIKFEVASKVAHTGEPLQPKRAIGVVMGPHGKVLRPHIRVVQAKIEDIVNEVNAILDSDGVEGVTEYFKDIELPNTDTVINSDKLIETFKRIKVAELLKKITDPALKKRADRIKPPSDGKAAGVSWPQSAGGNFNLWLTTDPFEMLTKSTGRKWSERNASCENWDGCYSAGPMSDIMYGNLIVWVYKAEDTAYRNELGRFILRWGDAVKDGQKIGPDIGVEAQVYPKANAPWGFNLLGAIGQILKDAGYLDYDSCRTPYVYKGYTDRGGSGNTRISYDSKIMLKGQGEVDVGGANALVTMASDENLSYADSGYILNYGNAQALLAMAQNPMVWIYENTIRRLFTRAIDLDEGPQIAQFLVQSSVANYDWMTGVLDLLPILDPNHTNPRRESLSTFMLKNANCSDFAQDAIIGNHPDMTLELNLGSGVETISLAIAPLTYLNMFESNWVRSMTDRFENKEAFTTNASAEILSDLVNDVTQSRFGEFNRDIMAEILVINGDIILGDMVVDGKLNPLFLKRYLKMKAMVALMNQPKLALRDFSKLLTSFDKMYRQDYAKAISTHKVILDNMKKMFVWSFAYPLQDKDNWGYKKPMFQNTPAVLRNMSLIVDGEEIKYPIYSRQSVGVFRRLYTLCSGSSESDEELRMLMLRNIRDGGVFREAVSDLEIPRHLLIRRMQDSNDEDASIANPFLNIKTYTDLVSTMTLEDFKLYHLDYEGVYRKAVPEKVLNKILSSEDLVSAIGFKSVGSWLTTPKQFKKFEKMVYKSVFGSMYRRNGSFEYYSDGVDLDEDFFVLLEIEDKMKDSQVLYVSALGLSSNQSVPQDLQIKILRDWSSLADYYSIPYTEFMGPFGILLASNPNIGSETIQFLMDNVATEDNDIFTKIISNARVTVGDEMIKTLIQDNPLLLLKNYNLNIRSYRRIFKDVLEVVKQPVLDDPERFLNTYGMRRMARNFIRKSYYGSNGLLTNWQQYLQDYRWIRYWRGGTFKKALKLPADPYNSAPMNPEKGRPQALVDAPVLIEYPHVIFSCDGTKDDDGNYDFTNLCYRYIKSVTQNADGSISAIADSWTHNEEEGDSSVDDLELEFTDVNDMYGFIPEDERADPNVKWRNGVILVLFDESNPKALTTLPPWRMALKRKEIETAFEDFLGNPKISDEDLDLITDYVKDSPRISSNEDSFQLSIRNIFDIVDKLNLWTPEYIDAYSMYVFSTGRYYDYSNLLPTAKCFEYSLAESDTMPNDAEEQAAYIENTAQANLYFGGIRLSSIQEWILSERYRDIIPILYAYECIVGTNIRAGIKTYARAVRDRRLAEYLNFVRRDENPEVNDAEEMHPYEWKTYNSEMNSILVRYCEKMYPYDPFMQEQLMESLIRGNNNVTLEQMANAVRGE